MIKKQKKIMLKVVFLLALALQLIICTPSLTSSGNLSITGAGTSDLPYRLYSDGDVRIFQWGSVNISCTSFDYLYANSAFSSSDITFTELTQAVIVRDYEEFVQGKMIVNTQGDVIWKIEMGEEFQSSDCGIQGGSAIWSV